jgi:hypothetical protein
MQENRQQIEKKKSGLSIGLRYAIRPSEESHVQLCDARRLQRDGLGSLFSKAG